MNFCGQKTPFWPTLRFKICIENGNFPKKNGFARNVTSSHKNIILRPLYNSYFWHFTIVKWYHICQNSIRKCFFRDIFSTYTFSILFPIIAVWALRQGERVVKNGFKRVFLGPYDIPHTHICQAKWFSEMHIFMHNQRGPARYDEDHRFNGVFFYVFPLVIRFGSLKVSICLKGLIPPWVHDVFFWMKTIFWVKKWSFFVVNIFLILDAIAESNIIFRGLTVFKIQRQLLIYLHTGQFTRNALQYNGKGSFCYGKAMLQNTLVTTKYSTPSQVITLVMPFPKLSLEPL